jgi:hypothetical protein
MVMDGQLLLRVYGFMRPGAVVPVDMDTTRDLVEALRQVRADTLEEAAKIGDEYAGPPDPWDLDDWGAGARAVAEAIRAHAKSEVPPVPAVTKGKPAG